MSSLWQEATWRATESNLARLLSLHDSTERGAIHVFSSGLPVSLGLSWKWRLRLYSPFSISQKHLRVSAAAFEGPSRGLASYHTVLAGQLPKAEPHSRHLFQTLPSETLQYWDGCTSNCHVISVSEEFQKQMVSTDDSDGCTLRTGQGGMSDKGVRIQHIPQECWEKREFLRVHLLSAKAATGWSWERKAPHKQWQGDESGEKRCFVSKVGGCYG